jgi:hypothetical protein
MSRIADLPVESADSYPISVSRDSLSQGVLTILRAVVEQIAPVGYQNITGFYFGVEPWPGCAE